MIGRVSFPQVQQPAGEQDKRQRQGLKQQVFQDPLANRVTGWGQYRDAEKHRHFNQQCAEQERLYCQSCHQRSQHGHAKRSKKAVRPMYTRAQEPYRPNQVEQGQDCPVAIRQDKLPAKHIQSCGNGKLDAADFNHFTEGDRCRQDGQESTDGHRQAQRQRTVAPDQAQEHSAGHREQDPDDRRAHSCSSRFSAFIR